MRDRASLEKLAHDRWARKCPHPERAWVFVPVEDMDFAPWVVHLKAQPWSTRMLVGEEDFVFSNSVWRELDRAFSRLKRFDSRYCCLYDGRYVLERSMRCVGSWILHETGRLKVTETNRRVMLFNGDNEQHKVVCTSY